VGTIYVSGSYRRDDEPAIYALDHGLLYGDGVFEGIRAYNGRVFKLERHVERLFASAAALRIGLPHTPAEIGALVLETCRRNEIVDGYIRVVVTRGRGDLGINPRSCERPEVLVIARPALSLYTDPQRGLRVVTSSFRRPAPDTVSPGIKSLNYVNNVLARLEANDRGADEALLLDSNGLVAEASADNVFIVTREGLATPPTATNLNGITRETVFEIAAELGIPCHAQSLSLFEVWTAREVFICGTGAEIVPVRSVDERPIGSGDIGEVTRRIMRRYQDLVRSTGTPIESLTSSVRGVRLSPDSPVRTP
jgi:branched-chain amino acid aminotransferase